MVALPNCIARESRDEVFRDGVWWVRCYCGSCGKQGPYVTKKEQLAGQPGEPTFAFWLCDPCFEKHGVAAGQVAIPDSIFWAEVEAAQLEEYGRVLSPPEVAELLKDETSILSKLARDRFVNPKYRGG